VCHTTKLYFFQAVTHAFSTSQGENPPHINTTQPQHQQEHQQHQQEHQQQQPQPQPQPQQEPKRQKHQGRPRKLEIGEPGYRESVAPTARTISYYNNLIPKDVVYTLPQFLTLLKEARKPPSKQRQIKFRVRMRKKERVGKGMITYVPATLQDMVQSDQVIKKIHDQKFTELVLKKRLVAQDVAAEEIAEKDKLHKLWNKEWDISLQDMKAKAVLKVESQIRKEAKFQLWKEEIKAKREEKKRQKLVLQAALPQKQET